VSDLEKMAKELANKMSVTTLDEAAGIALDTLRAVQQQTERKTAKRCTEIDKGSLQSEWIRKEFHLNGGGEDE
jgi:hypothetical protein